MTIDEAREHIGRSVVYYYGAASHHEHGVITGVGAQFAFVRFRSDEQSKATDPADLEPLAN